jgi:hypothetical protein
MQAITDLDNSEHWRSAALVVRELWLETIGVLQPKSQNLAEIEQADVTHTQQHEAQHG